MPFPHSFMEKNIHTHLFTSLVTSRENRLTFLAAGPEFKQPQNAAEHEQQENELRDKIAKDPTVTDEEIQGRLEALQKSKFAFDGSNNTDLLDLRTKAQELKDKRAKEKQDLTNAEDASKPEKNATLKSIDDALKGTDDEAKSDAAFAANNQASASTERIKEFVDPSRPPNAVAQTEAHLAVLNALQTIDRDGKIFEDRKGDVPASARSVNELSTKVSTDETTDFAKSLKSLDAAKGKVGAVLDTAVTDARKAAADFKNNVWGEIYNIADANLPLKETQDLIRQMIASIKEINKKLNEKIADATGKTPDAKAPDKPAEAANEKDLQDSSQKALDKIFAISTDPNRGPTAVKDAKEQNAILAANRKAAEEKGISHLSKIDAARDAAKDLSAAKDKANASVNDATLKKAIDDFKAKTNPTEADKTALKEAAKKVKDKIWTVDLTSESSSAITKNADEIIGVYLDAIAQINKQVDETLGVDSTKSSADKAADSVTEKEKTILEKILAFLEKIFKQLREADVSKTENSVDSITAKLKALDEEKKGLTEKLGKTTDKKERDNLQLQIDNITLKENELNRQLADVRASNKKLSVDLEKSAEGSAISVRQDDKGNIVLSARNGFNNQQFQNQVQYMQGTNPYAKRYIQPYTNRSYTITNYYAGRDLFINSNGNNSNNTVNSNNNNGSNRGNFTDNRRFDNRSFDNRVDARQDNRSFDNRVTNNNSTTTSAPEVRNSAVRAPEASAGAAPSVSTDDGATRSTPKKSAPRAVGGPATKAAPRAAGGPAPKAAPPPRPLPTGRRF